MIRYLQARHELLPAVLKLSEERNYFYNNLIK